MVKEAALKAIERAIKLGAGRKFKQSVELIVTFKGVDPKSPDIKFRDAIYLPRGLSATSRVLLIADGEMLMRARELRLEVLGRDELQRLSKREVRKIACKYDWFLVKSDLMALVGRVLGPALGPRGKFPIPIPANADLVSVVRQYSMSVRLRNKEQAWVGCKVGDEGMRPEDISENVVAVLEHIRSKVKRPLEGLCRVYVKTTMGPPVEVMLT